MVVSVEVTKEIIQHLSAGMNLSKKEIIYSNFLGGIAWGAGTVLGAIIIAAIIFYTLKPIGIYDLLVKPAQETNPLKQSLPVAK